MKKSFIPKLSPDFPSFSAKPLLLLFAALLLTGGSLFSPPALASDAGETDGPPAPEVSVTLDQKNWPMTVDARIDIPSNPRAVWKVLTDYDHLADYLPRMESSQVIARENDRIVLKQVTESRFLFFRKKVMLWLDVFEKGIREISFQSVKGDMERFDGKWILEEIEDGRSTRLNYHLAFKPSFFAPKWIIRHTLLHDLPEQLRLIAKKAGEH